MLVISTLAGLPGNLKTVWLLLLAASFFVSHRLKSPFGSASSSHMAQQVQHWPT